MYLLVALLLIWLFFWFISFYLFGMQRTIQTMQSELTDSDEYSTVSYSPLYPNWFLGLHYSCLIVKLTVIVSLGVALSWPLAIGILLTDILLTSFLPVPHQVYKKLFFKRAAKVDENRVGKKIQYLQLVTASKVFK